jgi:transmembrane sensor
MASGVKGAGPGVALDDPVAEDAIHWMVVLQSGEAGPEEQRGFSDWLAIHPRHAEVWARMQNLVQRSVTPVHQVERCVPGQSKVMERVMLRPLAAPHRRRALRQALGLAAVGIATGALTNRFWPLTNVVADLSTGTGQRARFSLPDGSVLVLNAKSAVDIDFSGTAREVTLRQGALIATVAPDANRPFIVRTRHGTARALGTRFLISLETERSMALVLEHSIRVESRRDQMVLEQGEAAYFQPGGIERLAGDATGRAAWAGGMLVAEDQPLADVIDALRPYRAGLVRVSPEAARLRVLGSFPLDDTDNILRSLEQTMPLRIRRFGGLLVTVDLR